MPKSCVNPVHKLGKSSGQTPDLLASSTGPSKYIMVRGFFMLSLRTDFKQAFITYQQPVLGLSCLLGSLLYPLSTRSMTNTKLIKD